MSECCKTGFQWGGTPVGTESTLGQLKTYVTGSNKDAAVLLVHDVFGWTFTNLRLLADHYAKEANVTAYLPDFYAGDVVDPDTMDNPEKREKFNVGAFLGKHGKQTRGPEIFDAAKTLKSQYKKVAAIGFCWGAWGSLQVAAKGNNILDAVSVAHPSLLEKSEIENIGVPVQFLAPETDPQFTPELKQFTLETLPKLNVPFEYIYFPGLVHGFAAKADKNDPKQKDGLERAKNSAVNFFKQYLGETR
ncbi:dienelactone hydrolase family protein [Viridothelium virens]|uniref:Dienelactone hydrolase family protein n=1 Tax=Viridothelium virens TaxID=1048519 RepID=A0A6A6HFX2_VIRVR|nr:dienelactone hydrolase family protein [Viridothelium virens]